MRVLSCVLRRAPTAWTRSRPSCQIFLNLTKRLLPVQAGLRCLSSSTARHESLVAISTQASVEPLDRLDALRKQARNLPQSCPGCGAPSQTVAQEEAGYYNLTRSGIKSFLNNEVNEEDKAFDFALQQADSETLNQLGVNEDAQEEVGRPKSVPICDRCHNLIHHNTGVPIYHPSIQSIQDIIEESPYKENHIYHVVDAADFPMSLIPSLQDDLRLPRLRTQNRRSKTKQYIRGRVAEVSFIITRSDLLAPNKEQVDTMMPYLREVLRGALGGSGKNVRLGNVRCVSAKRGWWTKDLKEDIWTRGGAGWMVGKVNVGKSKLFEEVFPKGRSSTLDVKKLRNAATRHGASKVSEQPGEVVEEKSFSDTPGEVEMEVYRPADKLAEPSIPDEEDVDLLDEDETGSLLPPARLETDYPDMPIVSHLPGTTASPIRVPFGNGRGELIDLPGIARSSLEDYVKPEHKEDLVMKDRITPEQVVVKPGQSLLLGGGLIRVKMVTTNADLLTYAFMPLHSHATSNDKIKQMETGTPAFKGIPTIARDGVKEKLESAGTFQLRWDITKKRAGPLTSPSAVKLKTEQLPFTIFGADVLIEGVGWVELAAQMRKKPENATSAANAFMRDSTHLTHPEFPEVQVYSPGGRFIAIRPPMNAWLLGGKKSVPKHQQKSRPRKSMRSLKLSTQAREKNAAP